MSLSAKEINELKKLFSIAEKLIKQSSVASPHEVIRSLC